MALNNAIPIPLYHGTDRKILNYSENERIEIQNICFTISDYIYHLLVEDGLSLSSLSKYKNKRLSEIGDYWPRVIDVFQRYDSRKKGSKLYQYGYIYLTGDREKAENYARNAFVMGEQGNIAYWLYLAASNIWNLKELNPDMKRLFISFENLIEKPRIPVLLTFIGIQKDDLLREHGEEINWEMWGNLITGLSFRLKANSKTSLLDGKVEYL